MPGISQPFPNIFDPLSFLSNAGSSNTAVRDLKRWRESEITHGRVAMLVSLHLLGCALLVAHGIHHVSQVPAFGQAAMLLFPVTLAHLLHPSGL